MDPNVYIENTRGSVMSNEQFREFITTVYHLADDNYSLAARWLGDIAPNVQHVVSGGNSNTLRRKLRIKKSSRTRACFECTPETRHNINILLHETGMNRENLLEEMVENMFEKLGGMDYLGY